MLGFRFAGFLPGELNMGFIRSRFKEKASNNLSFCGARNRPIYKAYFATAQNPCAPQHGQFNSRLCPSTSRGKTGTNAKLEFLWGKVPGTRLGHVWALHGLSRPCCPNATRKQKIRPKLAGILQTKTVEILLLRPSLWNALGQLVCHIPHPTDSPRKIVARVGVRKLLGPMK